MTPTPSSGPRQGEAAMSVLAPSRPAAARPPAGRVWRATWAWPALALLLVAGGAMCLYLGRGTSFYFDEWNIVLERREWTLDALLRPHNEHLYVAPVLVYKVLFATAGLENYVPYRIVSALLALLVSLLIFIYARRRVGDPLALACAALLVFLGSGWIDLLWPFQIGLLGSLAAGIGALLCLDRGDRRGDLAAGALLAVALAFSSLGIPLLVAAAVEVIAAPTRRRSWPVIAAPAALYALWYVVYHEGGQGFTGENAVDAPRYVAEAGSAAAAAVFGLGGEWGRILLVALLAALVARAWRFEAVPWRLAALVTLPLAFWGLTALARAHLGEPTSPRYLYPGAALLLLVAVEAARGTAVPRRALALAAVLVAASVVSNVGLLRDGGIQLRSVATTVRGALAATELAAGRIDPQFIPEPTNAPQLHAGPYLAAVRELGSPIRRWGPIERDAPSARVTADGTLQRAYALALAPAQGADAGTTPPVAEGAAGATLKTHDGCLHANPAAPGASVALRVPAGGLLIVARGRADVTLRRFADAYPEQPLGSASGSGGPVLLRIPTDRSSVPWHARVTFDAPARLCEASRP